MGMAATLDDARRRLVALNAQRERHAAEADECRAQLACNAGENGRLAVLLAQLHASKALLDEQLEEADDRTRQRLNELDNKLEAIELTERLQRKLDSRYGAAHLADKLEAHYEAANSALLEAKEMLREKAELLQVKDAALDDALDRIERAKGRTHELDALVDVESSGQRSLAQRATHIDYKLGAQQEQLAHLRRDVETMEGRGENAEQLCTQLGERVDDLEGKIADERRSQRVVQDEVKQIYDELGMIM